MLNEDRTRRPPAFLTCAAALLGMLLMSVPIAALKVTPSAAAPTVRATVGPDVTLLPAVVDTVATTRPRTSPVPNASRVAAAAQQTPAGVTGVVVDPSGAVLPGVEVTLTDAVGIKYGAVTDGQGEFALNDLPPGRYEMVTSLPGFSPLTNVFNLAAGSRLARRFMLPVGSVEETLTVVCTAGAPGRPLAINQRVRTVPVERIWDFGSVRRAMASSAPELAMQAPLAPGRVGGQLRPPRKLRNANPVCPPLLLPADDAIANFVGRIGIDGYMNAVRHVPADSSQAHVPPEFIEAAMDAIREWAFTPTLLNGQPIEVEMTVAVRFRRG